MAEAAAAITKTRTAKAYVGRDTTTGKCMRSPFIADIKAAATEALAGGETPKFTADEVDNALFKLESNIVRQRILNGEPRIDGRDAVTVRPITVKA